MLDAFFFRRHVEVHLPPSGQPAATILGLERVLSALSRRWRLDGSNRIEMTCRNLMDWVGTRKVVVEVASPGVVRVSNVPTDLAVASVAIFWGLVGIFMSFCVLILAQCFLRGACTNAVGIAFVFFLPFVAAFMVLVQWGMNGLLFSISSSFSDRVVQVISGFDPNTGS
jgi:hypothetical protein